MQKIIVVVGPTGTGKTSLALQLAKEYSTSIISADSRQVYCGADIGTNKIPYGIKAVKKQLGYWLLDGVNVHLYDVVTPAQIYSVSQFVNDSISVCETLWQTQKIPVVAGGTGFYVDTLLGFSPYSSVPPNNKLRDEARGWNRDTLHNKLQTLDEDFYLQLSPEDLFNHQRLVRYIELAEAMGGVRAALQWSPIRNEIEYLYIGLMAEKQVLYIKAEQWVQTAFREGLVEETKRLIDAGFKDTSLLRGMIYQPTVAFISHTISETECINTISLQMRRYIKRQMTWFRRRESVRWFDVSVPTYSQEVHELVESFIES